VAGLAQLLSGFEAGGLADLVGSWVGMGPNKTITPKQVKKGLGPEKLAALASQSGLSVTEVAKQLAKVLPGLVNVLTPEGKLPSGAGLDQALKGLQAFLPKS
jgi:uncharacterized protein YidB (DUF937 family)